MRRRADDQSLGPAMWRDLAVAELEQQVRRGGRPRHLVHRDDRHHRLRRVLDRDERDVHQAAVELVGDPVLPGVEEDALDALALQLVERLEQRPAVERREPAMLTKYPCACAARSSPSSTEDGPNATVSMLMTPSVFERPVTSACAARFGR